MNHLWNPFKGNDHVSCDFSDLCIFDLASTDLIVELFGNRFSAFFDSEEQAFEFVKSIRDLSQLDTRAMEFLDEASHAEPAAQVATVPPIVAKL